MHRTQVWFACLVVSFAGFAATANADKVDEALAEVRHVKADLFSQDSSVLGKLPTPAEMAAHQLRCRPLPVPKAGVKREIVFDAKQKQYAAKIDLTKLKKMPSRMGLRCLPLGITGAHVTEFTGRTDFLVVHVLADSPAAGVLKIDDVIFGANGRPFVETEDPRPEMGNALIESQSPQLGGILTLHAVRDGKPINVKIDLGNTLSYSDTWPMNCEKTRQMRQDAVDLVIKSYPWHRYNFWTTTFLMASGDEAAMELARRIITDGLKDEYPEGRGCSAWVFAYRLLNLCEYYLLTGDSVVLPAIRYNAQCLAWAQYRSGSWSHGGGGDLRAPGTAFGGYGEVNCSGLGAFAGLAMARECGIEPYDHTLPRSIRFYGEFCGSNFPYGLGRPGGRSGRMDNGMMSMAAMGFHMLGEEEMAQRWARSVCYTWMGRERGHAEAIFSAAWGPVGAALAPEEEFLAFMSQMRWAYEMGRARDGGLTFMRGSRWTYPNMTAAMGLALCIPERRLQIMGAEKSVFAQTPPKGLEKAAQLYKDKKWKELRTFLADYINKADKGKASSADGVTYAKKLLAAHDRLEKHAAATLKIIAKSIDDGKPATAQKQLDLLAQLMGEERPEAARLRKLVGEEPLKDPRPTPLEPLVDRKAIVKELGLSKGGMGDGFACSPEYIGQMHSRGFEGMPAEKVAGFLAHFNGGPAGGATRALAARGEEVVPLLKRLLKDSHPGIRSGAVSTLESIYKSDSDEYRTEAPEELTEIIKLIRPMTTDESPLVRNAVGSFVLSIKVVNDDVYEMIFEMIEQGGSGLDSFARHGAKDPKIRTKLCMELALSGLAQGSESPASYKPFLYPAMAHIEECEPYIQTTLDLMSSPKVLGLYGFFSNCPRDGAMGILDYYHDHPLVLKSLPVILEVSFRHGSDVKGPNDYTIRSTEYPHRIVLRLGPKTLPAVKKFLQEKRAKLKRIESGKEEAPQWWKAKQPSDFQPWFQQWARTERMVRCLYSEQPVAEKVPALCEIYLADRDWGEWERGMIRDAIIDLGAEAAPIVRGSTASALTPILEDLDKQIAAKQAQLDAADKKSKRKLQRELDTLNEQKVIPQQRADELNELAMLIEHFAADEPSQKAVNELCTFYVKRPWGTAHPRQMGETSYIRPHFARPVGLVRDTLLRWGKPALPMIRRFQKEDEKTLSEALAYLTEQEEFWKTQWSRKAKQPLSRIAMERQDLPRVRAELNQIAQLIECSGRKNLTNEQIAGLCQTYTRCDWPAPRAAIRDILKAQPKAAAVVKQHIFAEKEALPGLDKKIKGMFGSAVVPRVCISYNQLKSQAKNIRQGTAELESLMQ